MSHFYRRLDKAYAALEQFLTKNRKKFADICLEDDTLLLGEDPKWTLLGEEESKSRQVFPLCEGYILKVRTFPRDGFSICFPQPAINELSAFIESNNVWVLRKYGGFTKNNHFWVPEHKVVGVNVKGESVKINTCGYGFTIAEDISEGGAHTVHDSFSFDFNSITNKEAVQADYQRHIDALVAFCERPDIHVSEHRHGGYDNLLPPIKRMLFIRTKNDRGEVVLGDLDNIVFDHRTGKSS